MKFAISLKVATLAISFLSATHVNAQTKPLPQPSAQPVCIAVKPVERSTPISEQPTPQNSTQVQQGSECALNVQPDLERKEPRLSERDRLIKERFEQQIIPLQD